MGRNSLLTLAAVLILATTRQGGAAGDAEAGAQVVPGRTNRGRASEPGARS
jgi:hypothetical protein